MVMTIKNQEMIYAILKKELTNYRIPLAEQINVKSNDPFFVLVGALLSARTKDETTARVCDALFKEVKSLKDLRGISQSRLEELVHSVGFYKTKARHLKELAELVLSYNDRIPDSIDELVKLPGVGQKTANLVVSVAFNKPAICVDTHVHRITNRIGLVKTKTPYETEMRLRLILKESYWQDTNYLFVILGQNICTPISPYCSKCYINRYCERNNVTKSR